jgi:flagellar protein FlbD
MIRLTKLNDQHITINALYIERIEETPDSVITLTTDKKIVVKESAVEIADLAIDFYRKINLFQEMKEVRRDV